MPDYPLLLTKSEAAEVLGLHRDLLLSLISRGEIGIVPVGSDERVPRAELERWVRENTRNSRHYRPDPGPGGAPVGGGAAPEVRPQTLSDIRCPASARRRRDKIPAGS